MSAPAARSAARVASAAPDGYTLLAGSMGSHVSAPVLTPNVKYDPGARLRADQATAHAPAVIVARKDFPPRICVKFLENLKRNGDGVKQAHGGTARHRTWPACCFPPQPA